MPRWLSLPLSVVLAASAWLAAAFLFRTSVRQLGRRERGWPGSAARLACLTGMLLLGMSHPLAREVNDTGPGTTFAWLSRWLRLSPWSGGAVLAVAAVLALRADLRRPFRHPLCRLAGDILVGCAAGYCAALAYNVVLKAFLPA